MNNLYHFKFELLQILFHFRSGYDLKLFTLVF